MGSYKFLKLLHKGVEKNANLLYRMAAILREEFRWIREKFLKYYYTSN